MDDYTSVSSFLSEGYHKMLILIAKACGKSFTDTIWRLLTWNMTGLAAFLQHEEVGAS